MVFGVFDIWCCWFVRAVSIMWCTRNTRCNGRDVASAKKRPLASSSPMSADRLWLRTSHDAALGPLRSERLRLAWASERTSRCSGILRIKAAHCTSLPSGCTRNWRSHGSRHRNACGRQSSWRTAGRRRRPIAPRVSARPDYASRPATRLCEAIGGQAPLEILHGSWWRSGASRHCAVRCLAWQASRHCAVR